MPHSPPAEADQEAAVPRAHLLSEASPSPIPNPIPLLETGATRQVGPSLAALFPEGACRVRPHTAEACAPATTLFTAWLEESG